MAYVAIEDDWPDPVLPELPDWYDTAPCVGAHHLFFPQQGGGHLAKRALEVCSTCEHRKPCLALAMESEYFRDGTGIWGGTTPQMRSAKAGKYTRSYT